MSFCQNLFLKLIGFREMHSNCFSVHSYYKTKCRRVESNNLKTPAPNNDHDYLIDHNYEHGHNTLTFDNNNESEAANYMDNSIDIHQTRQLHLSNDYHTTCELDIANSIQVFKI